MRAMIIHFKPYNQLNDTQIFMKKQNQMSKMNKYDEILMTWKN